MPRRRRQSSSDDEKEEERDLLSTFSSRRSKSRSVEVAVERGGCRTCRKPRCACPVLRRQPSPVARCCQTCFQTECICRRRSLSPRPRRRRSLSPQVAARCRTCFQSECVCQLACPARRCPSPVPEVCEEGFAEVIATGTDVAIIDGPGLPTAPGRYILLSPPQYQSSPPLGQTITINLASAMVNSFQVNRSGALRITYSYSSAYVAAATVSGVVLTRGGISSILTGSTTLNTPVLTTSQVAAQDFIFKAQKGDIYTFYEQSPAALAVANSSFSFELIPE